MVLDTDFLSMDNLDRPVVNNHMLIQCGTLVLLTKEIAFISGSENEFGDSSSNPIHDHS